MLGPALDEFDLEYAASIARRAVSQLTERGVPQPPITFRSGSIICSGSRPI
jgi:hypothetical protein